MFPPSSRTRREASVHNTEDLWQKSPHIAQLAGGPGPSSSLWTDRTEDRPFLYHQEFSSYQMQPMSGHATANAHSGIPNFWNETTAPVEPTVSLPSITESTLPPVEHITAVDEPQPSA